MKTHILKASTLFIGAALGSFSGYALASDTLDTLDQVLISASRGSSTLREMAQSTTVISQEDIARSPAQTVDQLLADVMGFNQTNVPATLSDPTGTSLKMRGLTTGSGKVLVLLDGVPIMDPFYETVQWFKVPMANIERIEVVRGGNSALWGSMAVAGVVNIISKHLENNEGVATAGGGSFSTFTGSISRDFAITPSLNIDLGVSDYQTAGYQTTPAQYVWMYPGKNPASDRDTSIHLDTYYHPNDSFSAFLRLNDDTHAQNLGYAINGNTQHSPNLSAGLNKSFSKSTQLSANLWSQYVSFEKYNGASCYWTSSTSCVNANSARLNLTTGVITGETPSASALQYYSQYGSQRYRENGGSVVLSERLDGVVSSIQVGADYRRLSAHDIEFFYKAPASSTGTATQTLVDNTLGQANQTFEGLFGQIKFKPLDKFEATLNARYDNWRNSNEISQLTTAANVTSGGSVPEQSKSGFEPGLGIHYDLTQNLALRGSAYKTFRAPGFNNMLRSYGTGSSTSVANPNLAPENMTGGELGADWHQSSFSASATAYQYKISNMIATYKVLVSSAASLPAQVMSLCGPSLANCGSSLASGVSYYTNDQDGISRGYELNGKWKVNKQLTTDANLTLTRTYLTSKSSAISTPLYLQLAGVPEREGNLGVNWAATQKIGLYGQLHYVGKMPIDVSSAGGPYYNGGTSVFNLSGNYSPNHDTTISASVLNLFNRQYTEGTYTYNQPYSVALSQPRALSLNIKYWF